MVDREALDALLLPPRARLLHIGPMKTGTTSLQLAAHRHRSNLLDHGVRYPGAAPNHRRPLGALIGWAVDTWRRPEPLRPDLLDVDTQGIPPRKLWDDLRAEMDSDQQRRMLITHEFVSQVDDLVAKRVIDAVGDRIHVCITLRSAAQIVPSLWSQSIRDDAQTEGFEDWLNRFFQQSETEPLPERYQRAYDQGELVERWARLVGAENVTTIIVDKSDPGLLVAAFEAMLGLPAGALRTRRKNDSLTATDAELFRHVNEKLRDRSATWSTFHQLVWQGAIKLGPERREIGAGEPRIGLPTWAAEIVRKDSTKFAKRIRDSGVRVVGNLDNLVAQIAPSPWKPITAIPVDIAAEAVAGAVLAGQNARTRAATQIKEQAETIEQMRQKLSAIATPNGGTPAVGSGVRENSQHLLTPTEKYGPAQDMRGLVHEYEVADILTADGRVPLNYFTYRRNLGDLIGPWIVSKVTGYEVAEANRAEPHYMLTGATVGQTTDRTIVWGAGAYGTEASEEVSSLSSYLAVRGPLTRAKLSARKGFGLEVPEVYGDPTLLAPLYYAPDTTITHEFGVIIRWSERRWAEATYGPGVLLIDFARDDVEDAIDDILACRQIVSSSVRGLMLADAYGVPSAWMESESLRGGSFQFYDYFAAVEKFRRPHRFDPVSEPVTAERIQREIEFDDRLIRFDYRAFLDSAPFLRRVAPSRTSAPATPAVESATSLAAQPGTETLLPSLGHFGGIAANYLSVRARSPISGVRLRLPESKEGELDLRGIELRRDGRRIGVSPGAVTVRQSSVPGNHRRQGDAFTLGGIRTAKERGAWWDAAFSSPIDADEVRVYNRIDGWGVRARSLEVVIRGNDGAVATSTCVDGDDVVLETLALLERIAGKTIRAGVLSSRARAQEVRQTVVAALARRTSLGPLTEDREEQRLLAAVIRRHRLPSGQSLSDDEWILLGHFLAAERMRLPSTKTSVASFHRVLDTRAKLSRLEVEVNRAADILRIPETVLTRHGMADAGALQKRSGDFTGLIRRATTVLRECGFTAMLAYGTLLGAVREGNFLAHDDDIDLLIPIDASDREGAERILHPLAQDLRSLGWRVTRPNAYMNFHLTEPRTGLHVDVFPALLDGEQCWLHMEKMRLRSIPKELVLPPKSITFMDHEMLVPAKPEEVLAERYGPGWSVADPFDDWPWKLQS